MIIWVVLYICFIRIHSMYEDTTRYGTTHTVLPLARSISSYYCQLLLLLQKANTDEDNNNNNIKKAQCIAVTAICHKSFH